MAVRPADPLNLYDLRRTAASGMAALKVAPHVIERLLNHSNGAIRGVAAIYNRHTYLPELQTAVDLWASHIQSLLNAVNADKQVQDLQQ